MSIRNLIICSAVFAALAGCSTIESAREAQRENAVFGDDGAVRKPEAVFHPAGKSLPAFIEFAITNRPSFVQKRLAVEDSRLALKAIRADAPLVSDTPWTSPSVSLSAGYSESAAGTTMGEHDFTTSGGPTAGLSLNLPIWDFGRYDARAAAQAERVLAAELELSEEGYTVFSEVTKAYFDYLENRALLEVALSNRCEYAEHYERAKAMAEAGEAQNLDVLKARLDLASAAERTVSASNAVETAAFELMRSLGLGIGGIEESELEAFGADALGTFRTEFVESTVEAEEACGFAMTNAPAMRVLRARLRASAADVDYAVADLLPDIKASLSLSWTDPLWYWNWGVSAAQSLFQGFRKTTAVDRAVVSLKSAAAAVEAAEQRLSSEIATAVAARDNARVMIVSASEALAAAKENLQVVKERYELGDASRVDYTDAVSAYIGELGTSVSAFYAAQNREADLTRLLGK